MLGVVAALALIFAPPIQARPADARLIVTVVDQSGGVIPGATVSVLAPDDGAKVIGTQQTTDKGLATFEKLAIARVTIRAQFSGFANAESKDVRLRAGDSRQTLTLTVQQVEDTVTITRDARIAASDPKAARGTTLTKAEIEALPDDPADMAQQLIDMAGGNAIIKVDGFTGAPLPRKSRIKSIHIAKDLFSAENHSAEIDEIEIITQPGSGPLEGSFNSRYRDGRLGGTSHFNTIKAPEQFQNYTAELAGTIIEKKMSFSLGAGRRAAYDTPIVNLTLPSGVVSKPLDVRRPNDNWAVEGMLDYALTRDHIARAAFETSSTTRRNLGVGAFDDLQRAYSTDARDTEIRVLESGPIGRRMFINTRFELHWTGTESRSDVNAITVRINEAATTGGAQVSGGRHTRDFEFASDVDYVRGMHSLRAGVIFEGGHYRADDASNYLGTYTFATVADLQAGKPLFFTQRLGDPLVKYFNMRSGIYFQDDLRLKKGLTISPGVRIESQTHVNDYNNIAPRIGMTWAPTDDGTTTIRASAGIFYNWVAAGTYEQTLRVDGLRQRDVTVSNPSYPVTPVVTAEPANRYVFGDNIELVRTNRVSLGIDRTISRLKLTATFSHVMGYHALRGTNLNAPANGVRPDARFATVIGVLADAETRSDQVQSSAAISFAKPGKGEAAKFWNPRRSTVRANYTLGKSMNSTDGAFAVPASGTLGTEWAPSPGDRRHRWSASLNTQAIRNLSLNLNLAGNTGSPYTITTGRDDNGDLLLNDRPVGVGRATVRTAAQFTPSLTATYTIPRETMKVSVNVSITNLTNYANYAGYSGVKTSPYYLQATSVSNPRKIDFGMIVSF